MVNELLSGTVAIVSLKNWALSKGSSKDLFSGKKLKTEQESKW